LRVLNWFPDGQLAFTLESSAWFAYPRLSRIRAAWGFPDARI
jgi:hypothetical protein